MIAEHVNPGWNALRVLVLSLGTFNMGLIIVMVWGYLRSTTEPAPYRNRKHVVAVSSSYLLLTAAVCTHIGTRYIHDEPVLWYVLPWGVIAFPLGTYALGKLIIITHGKMRLDLDSARAQAVTTEQGIGIAHDAAKDTVAKIDTAIAGMDDEDGTDEGT